MSNVVLNFNDLPKESKSQVSEGYHKLTIVKGDIVVATTGKQMLQLTHQIGTSTLQIKFDNYPILNEDGTSNEFGQLKLRRLLEAIKVNPGEFTLKTLIKSIMGKSFYANLKKNDRNYLTIGNFDDFISVSDYEDKEITPQTFNNAVNQAPTPKPTPTAPTEPVDMSEFVEDVELTNEDDEI